MYRDRGGAGTEKRLPDIGSDLAWGAAAALEIPLFRPGLGDSNLVPAILFPLIGYILPLARAVLYAAFAAGWLLVPGVSPGSIGEREIATAVIAVAGVSAGQFMRRKIAVAKAGADEMKKAISESRSLLLPWEQIDTALDRDPLESLENRGLLGWRAELDDAIRRVIEGLVPVTGAHSVYYVAKEIFQGGRFRLVAPRPAGDGGDGVTVTIPDAYVPVREALIFRRSFFAEGEEAAAWDPGFGIGDRRITGLAAVPVVSGEQVEGALLAFRCGDGRWADPVTPALEMGAYFIGREIERWREWYTAARYLAQREGLHRTIRTIAGIAERDFAAGERSVVRLAVSRVVLDRVRKTLAVERAILVESDADGRKGRIAWECAPGVDREGEGWFPLHDTYLEWVLKAGVHRMFSGLRKSPARHPIIPAEWADPRDDGYLLIPVGEVGEFRGVLVCAAREGRSFHAGDVETARDILAVMRMGISHALREESLRKEATRDGLTGLYNQKTFRENLERVISRLDGRYPCAILMLDIDHFKRINDVHGHPAGDEVLRTVASVIRKTIRKGDMAGRYGGEEFVAYLNMADRAQALQGAERLRMMIRQTRFLFGGKEIGVTASFGVACYPEDGRTGEELLKKADVALYRSKNAGRDRTTIF